jgi:hypothetical protein
MMICRMLAARFGVPAGREEEIPAQVNAFLSQMSDMAGVGEDGGLQFDPSHLAASMRKLLGAEGEGEKEEEESSSDGDTEEEEEEEGEGTEDPVTRDYMERLDAEVMGGVRGRTDLADPARPLEVDSGLLANLLASYSAQMDMNGPAASLLASVRVNPGQKK